MTREEATRKIRMTPEYHYDGVYSHTETNVYEIIDQIFNDHEAQLKAKDEEIERLKVEISQMKCCENCEFQPNSECRFNTQYGCLDDIFPSNWKLKRSKQ